MDCLFCRIVAGEIPSKIIYQDEKALAFLDINPVQKGHSVVIPKKHSVNLLENPEALSDLLDALAKTSKLLVGKLQADGLNYLSNAGEPAGQSVFHTHIHLIPRFADNPGMANMLENHEQIDLAEIFKIITSA